MRASPHPPSSAPLRSPPSSAHTQVASARSMKTCWAESSTWSQPLSSPKYRRPAEDITQLTCGVSAILADRFKVQFLPYLEKRRLLSLHSKVKAEQPTR